MTLAARLGAFKSANGFDTKGKDNIAQDVRPLILTLDKGLVTAESLAEQSGLVVIALK